MAYNNTDYTDPRYREYIERLQALGPINNNEAARAYRELWKEFYGRDLLAPQ
jgi:hypothetical protein